MKNAQKLATAVAEAERFIERAKAIQAYRSHSHGTDAYYDAGPKETGAARRASLDLTRALADLRKPS